MGGLARVGGFCKPERSSRFVLRMRELGEKLAQPWVRLRRGLEFVNEYRVVERSQFQFCRKGAIGIGTLYVVAPTPTPPSHEFGGTVQTRRVEGHSAAQNM